LSDDKRIAWNLDIGSDVPTPVLSGGKLFLLGDKGLVSCLKPETGETLWSQQLPKSNRQYSSSPIVANGYLYCVREDATTFVLSEDGALVPNSESRIWSENKLSGNAVATPVFANDRVFLRTFEALYCIRK
jgi:outer membrane protein assembly factor BamB